MYDTLDLRLEGNYQPETFKYLSNVKEHQKTDVYYYSGTIGTGQQVWVFNDSVRFKGSLPKYHLNDNIKSIGRSDTQRAIESLSDELHIDLSKADVSQIDVGITIETKYKPATYYALMGSSMQYTRTIFKNSLYYKVTNREKIMYDKSKDAKSKGMIIPSYLSNANLFRYELRYLRQIDKQLNKAHIKAFNLYEEGFYMTMLDNWLEEYLNIKKLNSMEIDKTKINKPADLGYQILANLLLSSDIDVVSKVDELMVQAKNRKLFETANPSRDYSRAKQMVNKILSSGKDSELIKELDKKIKDQIKYYR